METLLFHTLIYLLAAVIAVPVAARLGLGSVLGYLLAGVLIGPVFGLVGSETQELQHVAEFGVVMMLFLIGLELDPRALWAMRHRLLGLGGLQITLTTAAVMGASMALGQRWEVALAIGLAFALSSTAIVLQTLNEKGLMQTKGGRSAFAVLLTQDIAVIPMLALFPLLAVGAVASDSSGGHGVGQDAHGDTRVNEFIHFAHSFVADLPGWGAALLTLGVMAGIVLAGIYLTRPVFSYIHASRLREMFTAMALLIVISIACIMLILGLSPALGTFLAGVVLANSEFRHEMEADLQPFKGLLLGLFFITVGAGINFALLFGDPIRLLAITMLLMVSKGLVLLVLGFIFKLRGRDLWLFTLSLAQAGEFGFVLVGFGVQRGVFDVEISQQLYLIVALSMMLTPLFFILYDQVSRRMTQDRGKGRDADEIEQQGPIIIAGVGRFGQVVNRMIHMSGFKATVLDHDLATIKLMRQFGFKGFLGDPTRPELLHAAGITRARILVVAMDDKHASSTIVRYARKVRPDLHIVARAHDRSHVYELYNAGANDIVREMFDSSLRAARYVLENMGLSEFEAAELEKLYFQMDRSSMLDLAKLWKPGVQTADNPEYIKRAKELNAELEAALISQLDENREASPQLSNTGRPHSPG
ncbi:monovalent cation:proton antiporter-2 (CPA2) family protein [Meridianimarinicoccus aquatilis]|uniref:Potassium transporter n=1 Tax=Meridianimarinicoccus aquatilis TaxID=2552766 RepID=A0A4R6B542_9RHOB|nr:monovalent cation:proton antiporter-2 (CPA2) family protein [Fluviibacterium aquatile]QIE42017.1 potassium transporter [Rhodobacteraceae bacterium SC52]TDL90716.1 potassium transporter [Fluviibacterium aquatile]